MTFTPSREHQWLARLVGEWISIEEVEATESTKATRLEGTETYRAIGAYWVVGEAVSPTHDGNLHVSQTTLGWDPARKRFVGSWIGSSMPYLWVYDGELDESGNALALYSEGPAMDGSGAIVPYKDVIAFIDDNTRTLTGHTKGPDGQWVPFTRTEYRRR
ncbi:MAG: DUF1579 domain-containing protein [Acidobacteriota bacterium]|jgi:hypothetical protein|nr:MAG: hypothetical protein DIU54_13620 [Acidobacteriota bacterium]